LQPGLDYPNHIDGTGVFVLTPHARDLRRARGGSRPPKSPIAKGLLLVSVKLSPSASQRLLRGPRRSVDTVATEDVLAVLKPIWTAKAETASRVRGRIEKILDAAKAKGFRNGENPARWRGHLDHLLPRRSKLTRGHYAAMPYEDVASFTGELRKQKSIAALALEFCILGFGQSGGANVWSNQGHNGREVVGRI
jgi:hypothetical protein